MENAKRLVGPRFARNVIRERFLSMDYALIKLMLKVSARMLMELAYRIKLVRNALGIPSCSREDAMIQLLSQERACVKRLVLESAQ